MIKKLLLTVALAVTATIPAVSAYAYDGITIGTISNVQVGFAGNFNIWLTGAPNLCTAAADKTAGQIGVGVAGVTADGQKAFLSLATAAYLSGRRVRVYTQNAQPFCAVQVLELVP